MTRHRVPARSPRRSPVRWAARVAVPAVLAALLVPIPGHAATAAEADDGRINLSAQPGRSVWQAVASDGATVVAVWEDLGFNNVGTSDIMLRRSLDGGATWENTQNLTLGQGGVVEHPAVAVHGDDVYVAYEVQTDKDDIDGGAGNHDIWAMVSHNGGRRFTPAVDVSKDNHDSVYPQLAMAGDRAVLAWGEIQDGDVWLTSALPDSGWRPQQKITDGAVWELHGNLAAADGEAYVAYSPYRGSAAGGVFVARMAPDGQVDRPWQLSKAYDAFMPKVAAGGGLVAVEWTEAAKQTDVHQLHAAVIRDPQLGDRADIDARPVQTGAVDQWPADVAVTRGRAVVTWTEHDAVHPSFTARTASRGAAPGPWTVAPTALPTPNLEGIRLAVVHPEAAQPTAAIDWTMPDRYGPDADHDGLIDQHHDAAFIGQTRFDVELDGCASTGGGRPVSSYHWTIDGRTVDSTTCATTVQLAEGEYPTTLRVDTGGGRSATATRTVTVQDHLVASIGDSVASGEGVPDVEKTASSAVRWQDAQCHRSAQAGPSRAALQLEQADRHSSVTFLHLACSGAAMLPFTDGDQTEGGVLSPYVGQEPGAPLEPQVDAAARLTAGRSVDAVTVSIGANDLKFSDMVASCIASNCITDEAAQRQFAQRLGVLQRHYDALGAALATKVHPAHTFLTQYFDPTHDQTGGVNLRCVADGHFTLVTDAEAQWAYDNVVSVLNREVHDAAARLGFTFVDGIADAFTPHGYCAQDGWVVQIGQAFDRQGNKDGGFHPNRTGHGVYADKLAAAIGATLPAQADQPPADGPADHLDPAADAVLMLPAQAKHLVAYSVTGDGAGTALSGPVDVTTTPGFWADDVSGVVTPAGLAAIWVEQADAEDVYYDRLDVWSRLVPVGAPGIRVTGAHLVQAPDDPRSLVEGKDTAIRLDLLSALPGTPRVPVTATVTGVVGGPRTFTELVALHGGRNEVHLHDPAGDLQPRLGEQVTATVRVDTSGVSDGDHSDDSGEVSLPVVESRRMRVLFVPLAPAQPSVAFPTCPAVKAAAAQMAGYLHATLPLAGDDLEYDTQCPSAIRAVGGERGDNVEATLVALGQAARATGWDLVVGVGPERYLRDHGKRNAVGVAMVGPTADSSAPTRGAIIDLGLQDYQGPVMAHELGHTWGLDHVDGVAAQGYWVSRQDVVDGVDFMQTATGGTEWVGRDTFSYLSRRFTATAPAQLAGGGSLAVSVERDASGSLGASIGGRSDTPPTVAPGSSGDVTVRLLDAGGDELGHAGIPLARVGATGEEDPADASAGAAASVPWVDGTTTVQVVAGDDVLREWTTGAAPSVEVSGPTGTVAPGGTAELSWSVTDADTDEYDLATHVEVSRDGGSTWLPAVVDGRLRSVSLPVPASDAGTTYEVRVTATDGIGTGTATTRFTVGARAAAGHLAVDFDQYFPSGRGEHRYGLAMVKPDGSGWNVVSGALFMPTAPAFSRDGKQLAWIKNRDLMVSAADGTDARTLAYGPLDRGWACPEWSADGRTVYAIGEGRYVNAIDVATGATSVFASPEGVDDFVLEVGCPKLSPDGTTLAMVAKKRITEYWSEFRIWLYDIASRTWRPIDTPGGVEGYVEALYGWTADGELLFRPHWYGATDGTWVISTDGQFRRLTDAEGAVQAPDGSGYAAGAWLGGYQNYDVVLLDNDGKTTARVTDFEHAPDGPTFDSVAGWDWQPLVKEEPPPPPAEPSLADAGGPYHTVEGRPVLVDATSGLRPNGEIPAYRWDLDGDGAYDDAEGATARFVPPDDGTFTVGLQAELADGTTATGTAEVIAENALAQIDVTPLTVVAGRASSLGNVVFRDAPGETLTADIDWGDGSDVELGVGVHPVAGGGWSPNPTHNWTTPGTYTATVWAYDNHPDDYSAEQFEVTVLPTAAPVVSLVSPAGGPAGGGQEVVISGDLLDGVDSVTFGDTPATGVRLVDAHTVVATAPALPGGGTVPVRVHDGGATSPDVAGARWTAVDEPPVVAGADVRTRFGTAVDVPLEVTDGDGGPAGLSVAKQPAHGTATLSGRTLRYTPDDGFAGTDAVSVRAGSGPAAAVSVRVGSRAPVLGPETVVDAAPQARVPVVTLLANDVDPDGDEFALVDVHGTSGGTVQRDGDAVVATRSGAGPVEFTYTVEDVTGMRSTTTSWVGAADVPPPPRVTADAGPDFGGAEGADLVVAGSVSDGASAAWTVEPVGPVDPGAICAVADPAATISTVRCTDDGAWRLTLTATKDGVSATDTALVTIDNAPPTAVLAVPATAQASSAVPVSVVVTDPGDNDGLACVFAWNDGTPVVSVPVTGGSCAAQHTWTAAGHYPVGVTVLDDDGGSVSATGALDVTAPVVVEQGGSAKAGSAIPITFALADRYAAAPFASAPVSARSTAAGTPTGAFTTAQSPGASGVVRKGTGRFQWVWKTESAWAGTPRLLVLRLADGSERRIVVSLR